MDLFDVALADEMPAEQAMPGDLLRRGRGVFEVLRIAVSVGVPVELRLAAVLPGGGRGAAFDVSAPAGEIMRRVRAP